MNAILNIGWFLITGLWTAIGWWAAGLLCYISIIGIPFGRQCFKNADLTLCPFGKEIVYKDSSVPIIANAIWILLLGWELALAYLSTGLIWYITIIGIPVGNQCLKLAQLSLLPFGAEIKEK